MGTSVRARSAHALWVLAQCLLWLPTHPAHTSAAVYDKLTPTCAPLRSKPWQQSTQVNQWLPQWAKCVASCTWRAS